MQQIVLRLDNTGDSEDSFTFQAGQYLEIVHPGGTTIPLSIASSPLELPELHLHYQSTPGAPGARLLDELLETRQPLIIRGPAGNVAVAALETRPLLLICGGTGASQAISILKDAVQRGASRPVTLLACADHEQDFYFQPLVDALAADWLEVVYRADAARTPENLAMRWMAEHGRRYQDRRIILCGSPAFVYTASDVLVAAGIDGKQLESDVFAYAPRSG